MSTFMVNCTGHMHKTHIGESMAHLMQGFEQRITLTSGEYCISQSVTNIHMYMAQM